MELKRLRYLRAIRGLSQDRIASMIEISQTKISRAEKGYIKLKPEEQKKIAEIFDCDPKDIFN